MKNIVNKNKCLFLTCSPNEYTGFPFMNEVPLEKVDTLEEMYTIINSCKFFVGNQSSPLVMAVSLCKPCLAEVPEGWFYVNYDKYYKEFNWISNYQTSNLNNLNLYINYS